MTRAYSDIVAAAVIDLRVGDIHSTDDDVTLFSPRRIVDALEARPRAES